MPQFLSLRLLDWFLAIFSWNSNVFHLPSPSLTALGSRGPVDPAGLHLVMCPLCVEMCAGTGDLTRGQCHTPGSHGLYGDWLPVFTLNLGGRRQLDAWWPLLLCLIIASVPPACCRSFAGSSFPDVSYPQPRHPRGVQRGRLRLAAATSRTWTSGR